MCELSVFALGKDEVLAVGSSEVGTGEAGVSMEAISDVVAVDTGADSTVGGFEAGAGEAGISVEMISAVTAVEMGEVSDGLMETVDVAAGDSSVDEGSAEGATPLESVSISDDMAVRIVSAGKSDGTGHSSIDSSPFSSSPTSKYAHEPQMSHASQVQTSVVLAVEFVELLVVVWFELVRVEVVDIVALVSVMLEEL